MDSRTPSIASIGIIGRHNNPLHISLFPATGTGYEADRDKLEYSFMLNSCLDIFEARMPSKSLTQDFGLLQALDERIAMYGWLTNTGVKFVVVVDMEGAPAEGMKVTAGLGLRNSDLTPVFQALQIAYIRLLRNPFYVPDDHDPKLSKGTGSLQVTSLRFIKEVERIGKTWYPGIGPI
ncbi:hypothetical protein LTR37_012988 [Vermiconidia calcicola]|uniref:Uncharacterized protein n=1 Tax=Vermiconidia calcicola TaxID=1690605 RepID=A0ACC3MY79_9PEZI|nr:hypothetical protein LTR37_012988 [Vermiconidia calcicola]